MYHGITTLYFLLALVSVSTITSNRYFPFFPITFLIYYDVHGNITQLMANTEIYSFLDNNYIDKFNSTNQKECVFNDAVNEVWKKCLRSMKGIVDFRIFIDWDRQYPMIKNEYRI